MGTFEHDLTKGNIWKQLVKFAVPFFISNLIQSLYSLVDLIILGHFGGTNSISAANIGGQVLVILTNLAAGLAGGGTVMIGNYLGSKQKDKINGTISTLLITLMVMAAVFMFFYLYLNTLYCVCWILRMKHMVRQGNICLFVLSVYCLFMDIMH